MLAAARIVLIGLLLWQLLHANLQIASSRVTDTNGVRMPKVSLAVALARSVPNDVSIKAGRANLIARRHLQEINASCANERIRTPFEAPVSGGGHQDGVRGDEEFLPKPENVLVHTANGPAVTFDPGGQLQNKHL